MTDPLKQYLLHKRQDLDTNEPAMDGWLKIEAGIRTSTLPRFIHLKRFLAAACLLSIVGSGLYRITMAPTVGGTLPYADLPTAPPSTLPKAAPAKSYTAFSPLHLPPFSKRTTKQAKVIQPPVTKAPALSNRLKRSYATLVNQRLQRVNHTPIYQRDELLFSLYRAELAKLNELEIKLKEELMKQGYDERKAGAILSIYKSKLSLLENLQAAISRLNKMPAGKASPIFLNL